MPALSSRSDTATRCPQCSSHKLLHADGNVHLMRFQGQASLLQSFRHCYEVSPMLLPQVATCRRQCTLNAVSGLGQPSPVVQTLLRGVPNAPPTNCYRWQCTLLYSPLVTEEADPLIVGKWLWLHIAQG